MWEKGHRKISGERGNGLSAKQLFMPCANGELLTILNTGFAKIY
jgi:hypothetical protein